MVRTLTVSQKKIVAADQRWRCDACDCLLPAAYEVDHITPLWNGGTDDRHNLVAKCGSCHKDKTYRENCQRTLDRRRQAVAAAGAGAAADAIISASRRAVASSKLPKVTKSPYFGTDSPSSVSTPDELAGQLARLGIIVRKSTRG